MLDESQYQLRDGHYHLVERRSSEGSRDNTSSGSRRSRTTRSEPTDEDEDDNSDDVFNEASEPQSEIVLFIARGVGVMVLITAMILLILTLMFSRAILAFLISKFGITGVMFVVCVFVSFAMRYGSVTLGHLMNTLIRSCS
jgi:uncharacterized membrane protein